MTTVSMKVLVDALEALEAVRSHLSTTTPLPLDVHFQVSRAAGGLEYTVKKLLAQQVEVDE